MRRIVPPRPGPENTPSSEKRRRSRQIRPLPIALALCTVAGIVFFAYSLGGRPAATYETATVPDKLLLQTPQNPEEWSSSDSPTANISALLPGEREPKPVLENARKPAISPDGRLLIFEQREQVGTGAESSVVALDSHSLKRKWKAGIVPSLPDSELNYSDEPRWIETAITEDRVYVAAQAGSANLPVTIVALDRKDGRETGRWSVGLADDFVSSGVRLFASPDAKKLYMVVQSQSAEGTSRLYYRFGLPEGELEERSESPAPSPDTYYPSGFIQEARVTPDGRTFYYLSATNDGSGAVVRFLDLKTGEFEPSLKLPLDYAYGMAVSHDGRWLYVLDPMPDKLPIVDLRERRLERVVDVDTTAASSRLERALGALTNYLIRPATAKSLLWGDMQLSPDGSRLYAVDVTGGGGHSGGVLVIDAESWQTKDRWLAGETSPSKMLLTGDGERLYVQGTTRSRPDGGALWVLNTKTGEKISDIDVPPHSTIFSPAELYRETYGKSPKETAHSSG